MLKNWCFWNVVLEKTLESPLDCKEIRSVNPNGNSSWIFIGRTDAEAPIPWPPDVKSWLIGKDPDAGKDWRQKEKRATEDEMVGWHQGLNGHELGQTLEIVRDREDWPGIVLGVTKSWTQLSNCTTTKAWRHFVLLKATQLSCWKAVTGTQVFWHLVQFSISRSIYCVPTMCQALF